eukprot:3309106-Prymnesium_polylepis.1
MLEPYALKQLEAWAKLRDSLQTCFGAATAFLVLGILCNLFLLVLYFNADSMAASVQSELLLDDPVTASLIGIFGIVNLGAFNALTQDQLGYHTVRWQSAASHIIWLGVPIIAIAATVLSDLDCGQRPCKIG